MSSPTVRRSIWVLSTLMGAVLWSACGSKSEENTYAAPPTPALAPFAPGDQRAPGFSLLDTQGKTVSLSDYKGKVVFIDFWATWCPPCRMSMPEVEKLYGDYQGKAVQVLGLNLDENGGKVRTFVEKKKISYPILLAGDSDISSAYGVSGIPHFALVDQEGRLVNEWSGFAPGMGAAWRDAINSLLGS